MKISTTRVTVGRIAGGHPPNVPKPKAPVMKGRSVPIAGRKGK